ncbi:8217_t:CDS:2 [Ambispora gerdemannii]|uniref:8217_t:CDS:1 n=1 Tax=Ambispora gerdemannii TaxID=144530 RepID=A0A9N9C7J5_9GLOM|nr:8217_t:CDS:2 [Ambispora gerdemannii]
MSKFQTLFLVIFALFFALALISPILGDPVSSKPPTPGGPIQVTTPSAGTYKFRSYQSVSWNANVDIPNKWNRTVDVWIAKYLPGSEPDILTYRWVDKKSYGNTYAGFQVDFGPGVFYAYVVVSDDENVWGTGPKFTIEL